MFRMESYILALLVLPVFPVGADAAAAHSCMSQANTQLLMNQCASKEETDAQGQANIVYRKILVVLAKKPNALRQLQAEERAWITYRDAYMKALYLKINKQAEYGSIFPMEFNLTRARLVREHTDELKRLLEQYEHHPK
jgi:uncharacterized protein YecT (DUF1311 family)